MDQKLFSNLCRQTVGRLCSGTGIGTLSEKTLHAVLKAYFEPDASKREVKVGRYVADIVNQNGITEIQTRAFHMLRPKLEFYLQHYPVTVVYPIAHAKWLCWIDKESGEITNRRKSPKTGSPYDAFYEFYKIKCLLSHPNLQLRLLLLDMEEYRYLDGWSTDKKKGSSRCERIPLALIEDISVQSRTDYARFVPACLSDPFTTKDFAVAAKIRQKTARTAVHILHYVGVINRIGKQGAFYLYERAISS